MPGTDDITSLLQPRPDDPPFRQGVILAFDPATGSNQIDVGGATLFDIPLLNIGDTVNLVPGDVVVLMKYHSSWAIMGRVVVPGSSGFASASTAFERGTAFNSNFAVTTSFVTYASFSLAVPSWADRALVTAQAFANVASSPAVVFQVRTLIDGAPSAALNAYVAPGQIGNASMGQNREMVVTPGGSILIEGQLLTGSATAVNAFTAIHLIANAIYRKA